jgi:glycolate oxidase iron-sulfur subunit
VKTAFTPAQLAEPEIAEADRILQSCVHYGFCTAVCPTYVLLRDENDAPRGRIDLIRAMLEKGGAPDAKTVGHIDRCLSCNACMTTCAAKVDYLHLADIGRAYIEKHFRRPLGDRLLRALLARTLTSPRRFRTAMAAAGLARPLARTLPPRLRNLVAMARPLPARREWTRPGFYPAQGKRRARVALLTGCVQRALAPEINAATIRLLTRHGCDVVAADQVECCGALPLHMGKEKAAKKLARRAIAAWSAERFDAVLVNASGCGTTVKDYGHLFREDPLAQPAAAIGARARDITEWIEQLGIEPAPEPVALTVAYHDACSLQHAQKVSEPPRRLLAACGFKVVDVPERHFCCGSAGTYNLLQPEIARQLGERKARHIESTGAAAVAAGNLGCIAQLARYTSLPLLHTVELLDWATGGPRPAALAHVDLPAPAAPDAQAVAAESAIW